jgi:hypothetical protein
MQLRPATAVDDTHTDNDPEEGEIVEINTRTIDDGGVVDVTDDMIVDQPRMESLEPSPSGCGPSDTPDSFSLIPLPQWCQRPQPPPISISDALGPGVVSLNSPEHLPVSKKNALDNLLSFFPISRSLHLAISLHLLTQKTRTLVLAEHYSLSASAHLKEVVKVHLLRVHHLSLAVLPPRHANALAMLLTRPQKRWPKQHNL